MAEAKTVRKPRATGRKDPAAKGNGRSSLEALAYQLWLQRGAPIGSPEADWFEAEALLASEAERKV